MSLIEKCRELAERQKSLPSSTYQSEFPEFKYECAVLNAAPAMLSVLGAFQPGDAKRITELANYLQIVDKIIGKFADSSDDPEVKDQEQKDQELLERLQKAAQAMEAECH